MTDLAVDRAAGAKSYLQRAPQHRHDRRDWRHRLGKQQRDQAAQGDVLSSLEKRLKRAHEQVCKLNRLAKSALKSVRQSIAEHQQRPTSTQTLSISSPGLSPIVSPSTPEEREEEKTARQRTPAAAPTAVTTSESVEPTPIAHSASLLVALPAAPERGGEESKAFSLTLPPEDSLLSSSGARYDIRVNLLAYTGYLYREASQLSWGEEASPALRYWDAGVHGLLHEYHRSHRYTEVGGWWLDAWQALKSSVQPVFVDQHGAVIGLPVSLPWQLLSHIKDAAAMITCHQATHSEWLHPHKLWRAQCVLRSNCDD